ncbi:MAG TPA: hypothetical protein VMU09_08630, partial [Acidimicrobiales bacterium]|nr:hypothetical protein [Acidimicrobiales bacterium]
MPDDDAAGRSASAGGEQGAGGTPAAAGGPGDEPKLGLWQRFLLALPSAKRDEDKPSLGERISGAVLKPVNEDAEGPAAGGARSVEDLEHAERYADDTERLIGLVAAPLSAAITLIIASASISHDPKNTSTYHVLELTFLVMAVLLMAAAWYRKRLFMGILLALIGLGMFNLRYRLFGIPFVLAGAWYLVRAYRAQRAVKEAAGPGPGPAPGRGGSGPS